MTPLGNAEWRVRKLGESDRARWDEFVHATADGTFFHLSGWRAIIETELGHAAHYLYCEAGGEIKGVLPLVHIKSLLFGNALISLPFLVYGGPVSSSNFATDALVGAAIELARNLGVTSLELRNRAPVSGEWTQRERYATFRRKISHNPDENLKAIPRKQRAVIRKAMRAGAASDSKSRYGSVVRGDARVQTQSRDTVFQKIMAGCDRERVWGQRGDYDCLSRKIDAVQRHEFSVPGRNSPVLWWRRRESTPVWCKRLHVLVCHGKGVPGWIEYFRFWSQYGRQRCLPF